MGGVISVDGEIHTSENLTLFQGSKKYPELAVLIEKPNDAHVCEGSGIIPYVEKRNNHSVVCYCGSLGWFPN